MPGALPDTAQRGGTPVTDLEIVGKKVRLRDWQEGDLSRHRKFQEPGWRWQQFDGPYYTRKSAAENDAHVERIRARVAAADWPSPRVVVVIADRQTNELIGQLSRYWQSEETHWLSLGVAVYDAELWGRGIGYEALGLWGEYLLDALPELERLDLRTWSGNHGMMRLAEKLGYRMEARFRKARVVDGQHFDALGYGVLREEWRERHPGGFAQSL